MAVIPPNTTVNRIFAEKLSTELSTQFIGDMGEIFYDPTKGDLRISDNVTPGGIPILEAINGASANSSTTPSGANTSNIVYNYSQLEAQGVINFGNVKTGFQKIDHFGWVLLNGRAISTLTATQQAICGQLGWSGNIPDARERVAKMNINPNNTAAVGGSDTVNLTQANLPNAALLGFATIPTYTKVDVIAAVNMDNPDVYGNVGASASAPVSVSLNPGAQSPTTIINQYININTFVYLGL